MSGPLSFDPEDEPRRPGGVAPPAPPPPARPRGSRYGWILALAFLGWIAYITFNSLSTEGPGSHGLPDDVPLPPFAVPLALSSLHGDANIASRRDQGGAGRRPACEVRGARVLNSCQLAERGPAVIGFYADRAGGACAEQLDAMERVRRRLPDVQFAAVAIRGERAGLRALVRRRGWGFPIGHDEDGQVANLYGVAGCPTTTFAYPGGIVMHTYLGLLAPARLEAEVRRLAAAARRRGWTPPRG
jgi:hypothetical protein